MSYHPEPDSHIRAKVNIVLDLSHYATKKIQHTTDADTSYLPAKMILLL